MTVKAIASTQAKINFGQILDDAVQHSTRYIVKRRNVPQVIILSLADFQHLLINESERQSLGGLVRELSPTYNLGVPLETE